MFEIEILAIGNELLLGDVLDRNSHWLCRRFTRMGSHVRRVVLLRDEVGEIADQVRAALARKPDLVVTTGGLGPTDDDLTLRGVATGLGRPLVENAEALALIEQHYAQLAEQGYLPANPPLTPARRKMAWLPRGGRPLTNPAGSAPGVLIEAGPCTLICLPGVPEEMQAIFEQTLAPFWEERFGGWTYAEEAIQTWNVGEVTLAPLLQRLAEAHPDVYIKSHARHFDPAGGGRPHVLITLSLAGQDPQQVAAELAVCRRELEEALRAMTGAVK